MGRQTGNFYVGQQGPVVYYQWRGGYYVRTKSSLSQKRFQRDPAFANSRKRAAEFGLASKLAAEVFQQLPKEARKRGMIGRLTGSAHKGLMAGKRQEEIIEGLLELGLSEVPKAKQTQGS